MPIYEFWCSECQKTRELNVAIDDRDHQTCECGEWLVRKLTFQGSVWAPTAGGMK